MGLNKHAGDILLTILLVIYLMPDLSKLMTTFPVILYVTILHLCSDDISELVGEGEGGGR
jgi:hypothetical protein